MTSLYKILKSAKLGEGAAQDFHTAIMAQKMPFAKRSGAEHEYTGAVPVTFIADGTPLLDYLISGNTVQSGTPTPDNPIMPQGTGEKSWNLFDEEYPDILQDTPKYRSIYVGNGTFTLSSSNLQAAGNFACLFLLSGNVSTGAFTAINGVWKDNPKTIESVDGYITIAYRFYANYPEADPRYHNVMLSSGSSALPYEPYGYKIPISSVGQTTPIYLGEVPTTRKIRKLVHDGTEPIYIPSVDQLRVPIGINLPQMSVTNQIMEISTHFTTDQSSESSFASKDDFTTRLSADANTVWYFLPKSFFTGEISVANCSLHFKTWLASQYAAGTPVTIWYVLANEETSIVNEPLMRIGNYADTLSHAQAGVSIPTANGSTTLDVETAVKPSEIYIKYKS